MNELMTVTQNTHISTDPDFKMILKDSFSKSPIPNKITTIAKPDLGTNLKKAPKQTIPNKQKIPQKKLATEVFAPLI